MIQDHLLKVFLHLRRLLTRQILEELTDADFDPLLTRVHHMLGKMAQKDKVVLLLVVAAEEFADG